ncbi:MAG: zinc-dependent metalloprotease [Polyangiales bacterium]
MSFLKNLLLASSLALVSTGGACASQREPISRLQPDYVKKLDLMGDDAAHPREWYMRTTVVGTARSNQFAFPGMQDELRRVRWDVQEHFLVARHSYELVAGSDGKGADPTKNDGTIVAIFPIDSHFDVRRDYNTTTGEELNVVVENTTDRPWFEREYMHVDWSRNLVTVDPDFLDFWLGEVFGEIKWENVAYYETDPASENRPTYAWDKGYFDLTQKWLAKTDDQYIPGWPTCEIVNWFTGSDALDCNDQEVTLRSSFMKVEDHDYEVAETNSETWSLFGTFNRDRFGFSRQYEILDKHWHRLMGRQNLWKKSHDDRACMQNGQAKLDADGFCGSTKGSICDAWAGKCTLPLATREVRTIPYFVSRNMPTDLWDENARLISEWNDALVQAVAYGREVECRRFGGDKAGCHGQFFDGDAPKASNGPALVLCHNPAIDGDHPSCGGTGTIAREGDLRFNLIGWVEQPLSAAPLGYGPNGADPLTGEVIQSTAYIYGASLDNYVAMTRDLVALADGDLSPDDFVAGKHLGTNLGTFVSTSPDKAALYAGYGDQLAGKIKEPAMTASEIDARLASLKPESMVAKIGANVEGLSGPARLAAVQAAIANRGIAGATGFGGSNEADANVASKAKKLAGTQTETNLIGNDQWLKGASLAVANDKTQAAAAEKAASPFGGIGPFEASSIRRKMEARLEARGVCMYGMNEYNAPHFEGLAKKLAAKYAGLSKEDRQKAVFLELRKEIYRSVTEHEVGHTMSLRHNFQGSWDSLNYHPNYWKLRTNDGKSAAACSGPRADGSADTCMGPRYLDPTTPEELGTGATPHAGIDEFSYASIMDYGYDFNSDIHGLGAYDKAAMKFVYAGIVETFPQGSKVAAAASPIHSSPLTEQWMTQRADDATGATAVYPTHYTTLARQMQTEKLLFDPARCTPPAAGEEDAAVGGVVCHPAAKDHAHVSELVSGPLDVDKNVHAPLWKTKDGRIRWPYRFGTDEYSTYPHTLRFDAGADVYEGALNVSRLYESRYLLDFFRRGRRGWQAQVFGIGDRLYDRYFSRMQSIGWLSTSRLVTYAAMYPSAKPADSAVMNSDEWARPYTMALTTSFDALERSILRPQPGGYALKDPVPGQAYEVYEVPDFTDGSDFKVGVLGGRWIDEDLSNAKGGSFHYSEFLERLGTYEEKPIAMIALTRQNPPVDTYLSSEETYVDGRNMLLNFRTLLPQAYDRLLAGSLANDTDALAPFVDRTAKKDSGGAIPVQYPQLWGDSNWKLGPNQVRVDPLVGFRFQSDAMILSMWLNWDGSEGFQDSMRVWIEGGREALPLHDDEKVFLYEPESGVTWAARKRGSETISDLPRPTGVGERMIMHANHLLAQAYEVELDVDGRAPKYDPVTHRPVWTKGPGTVKSLEALNNFRRYVGVINVLRQWLIDAGETSGYVSGG